MCCLQCVKVEILCKQYCTHASVLLQETSAKVELRDVRLRSNGNNASGPGRHKPPSHAVAASRIQLDLSDDDDEV